MVEAHGFGVPQLDALISPLPRGAAVLVLNDPVVQAEPFLYQAAGSRVRAGGKVVYLVTNRSPTSVLGAMDDYGFPATDDVIFVDAYSPLMGQYAGAAFTVADPADLTAVAKVLNEAAEAHPDAVLLVDTLSSFADAARDVDGFAEDFPRVLAAMKRFRFAACAFTKWPYPDAVNGTLDAFDGLVRLRGVEQRVLVSQYFSVERAPWTTEAMRPPRLYKAIKPGGVFVYIPKLVVTGPYNAGKSTFIQSVSDKAVSVDRLGTTVALDHGHVAMDGLTADLFGTPGQSRFDPILRTLASQAVGVVLVVDSTKPDSFPRARDMLLMTWKQGLPAVVAANKQDQPNALPPEEVARLIDPPHRVPVMGCVSAERDSGRRVLKALIDEILDSGTNGGDGK